MRSTAEDVRGGPVRLPLGGWLDGWAEEKYTSLFLALGVVLLLLGAVFASLALAGHVREVGLPIGIALALLSAPCFAAQAAVSRRARALREEAAAGDRGVPVTFPAEGNWLRRALEPDAVGTLTLLEDHLRRRARQRYGHLQIGGFALLAVALAGQVGLRGWGPALPAFLPYLLLYQVFYVGSFLLVRTVDHRVPWDCVLAARLAGDEIVLRVGVEGLPAEFRVRFVDGLVAAEFLRAMAEHLDPGRVEDPAQASTRGARE